MAFVVILKVVQMSSSPGKSPVHSNPDFHESDSHEGKRFPSANFVFMLVYSSGLRTFDADLKRTMTVDYTRNVHCRLWKALCPPTQQLVSRSEK